MSSDDGPYPPRPRPADHDPSSDPLVLDLTGELPPLAEVRRWTADILPDLTEEELTDLRLVVSELVTNAYQHGRYPIQVRLRRSKRPDLVRIEVTDLSSELPVVRRSSVRVTRGRGMLIVDRLCRQWGTVRNAVGKTVWAVLSREASHPRTAPLPASTTV